MNLDTMLNDPQTGWCDSARMYYKKYIITNNITTLSAGIKYIKEDDQFFERVQEINDFYGFTDDPDMQSKSRVLNALRVMRVHKGVLENACEFTQTNTYRLINNTSRVLIEGSKDEIDTFISVQYDDNEWWFAKGTCGTLLSNEEEVNTYQAAIVRERKYIDTDDNDIVLWRTE